MAGVCQILAKEAEFEFGMRVKPFWEAQLRAKKLSAASWVWCLTMSFSTFSFAVEKQSTGELKHQLPVPTHQISTRLKSQILLVMAQSSSSPRNMSNV